MDKSKETVVIGYDGSDESKKALDIAAKHAKLYKVSLTIVSAYSEPSMSYIDSPFIGISEVNSKILQSTRRYTEILVNEAKKRISQDFPEVKICTLIVVGRPSKVLIDSSKNAKLIVVGARGYSTWKQLLIGSTSTEIIHHAEVPVLIVR